MNLFFAKFEVDILVFGTGNRVITVADQEYVYLIGFLTLPSEYWKRFGKVKVCPNYEGRYEN